MAIIDMKTMRHINLLDKIAHVKTAKCFVHNNTIFFAVRGGDMSRAIGPSAINIRRIQEQLGVKVKIIREAVGQEDARRFIEDVVAPVRLKSVELKDGNLIITAGSTQNKASLVGRNRRRYEELKKVTQDFFDLGLKII